MKKLVKSLSLIMVMSMMVGMLSGCSVIRSVIKGRVETQEGVQTVVVPENIVKEIKSEKETYNTFLSETLIPKYGLADLSPFSTNTTLTMSEGTDSKIETRKTINLKGIASAYIDDMNGDGAEDLIVIRFKENGEDSQTGKSYNMIMDAYSLKGEQVELLDKATVGAIHKPTEDQEAIPITISEKETNDRELFVNTITDGSKKYVLVESTNLACSFADGIFKHFTAYELRGDELEVAYSFEQDYPGSAGFSYTGYVSNEKTLLYNEWADFEDEEAGKYETYDEALIEFWSEQGISVVIPNARESIVSPQSLVNRILSYEWISSNVTYDNGESSAVFDQVARDYTNVSEVQ